MKAQLTKKKKVNLFSHISIIAIKFLFRNIPTNQIASLNGFTVNFTKHLRKK